MNYDRTEYVEEIIEVIKIFFEKEPKISKLVVDLGKYYDDNYLYNVENKEFLKLLKELYIKDNVDKKEKKVDFEKRINYEEIQNFNTITNYIKILTKKDLRVGQSLLNVKRVLKHKSKDFNNFENKDLIEEIISLYKPNL